MALIPQMLAGLRQVQGDDIPIRIGCRIAHGRNQGCLQVGSCRQARCRMPLDPHMDDRGQCEVVAGNVECLEIGHRLGQMPRGQSAGPAELISRNALIGRRVHQVANNGQKLAAPCAGDLGAL